MSQRREPKPAKPKKLLLVEVATQATFVIVEGETATKVQAQPVVVSAEEWPTYPQGNFKLAMADLERQINEAPEQ